jgi:hypothetical protein
VVVRSGERVEAIDLHHEDLPDPVVDMFTCLARRIDRLERQLARDEALSAERGEPPFPDLGHLEGPGSDPSTCEL